MNPLDRIYRLVPAPNGDDDFVEIGGPCEWLELPTVILEKPIDLRLGGPGQLDGAPVMRADGGVDQIGAQPPEPRQCAILIRPGEPAVTDNVGDQDCNDFPVSPMALRRRDRVSRFGSCGQSH